MFSLIQGMVRPLLICFTIVAALLCSPALGLAQQPVPTPAEGAVIVEWTTESEVNQAGFNLYRGENADGPYTKLNDALIPASPDPVTGGDYSFTDTTAKAGVTYYYQLEDVELDGTTTTHGPVVITAQGNLALQRFHPSALVGMVLAVIIVLGAVLAMRRSLLADKPTKVPTDPDGEV